MKRIEHKKSIDVYVELYFICGVHCIVAKINKQMYTQIYTMSMEISAQIVCAWGTKWKRKQKISSKRIGEKVCSATEKHSWVQLWSLLSLLPLLLLLYFHSLSFVITIDYIFFSTLPFRYSFEASLFFFSFSVPVDIRFILPIATSLSLCNVLIRLFASHFSQ